MERDRMVPGTQARAGAGTDGQDLGIGATQPGMRSTGGQTGDDASLRDRGAGLAERGREKVEHAIDAGRERAADAVDSGREHAEHALDSGKARLADGISRIGERLDEQATRLEEQGGVGGRAGRYVQRASDMAEDSAEYLRTHDLDVIGDDFVNQIRARPLLSCGIALGAGFMLGSAGSSSSSSSRRSRSDRLRDEHDEDRHYRGRGRGRDHDDDESGVRAQLGRAVVSGVTALLTREIRSRVAGNTR